VKDESKKISANPKPLRFVTFPGNEIKDLYVHELDEEQPPKPPANNKDKKSSNPPRPPSNENDKSNPRKSKGQSQSQPSNNKPNPKPQVNKTKEAEKTDENKKVDENKNTSTVKRESTGRSSSGPAAGTGEHLLKMRMKKSSNETIENPAIQGEFDFEAGLNSFNKEELLATVAEENKKTEIKYKKDDFFDSLSSDILDREEGKNSRYSAQEERQLNTDTFGAIALQSGHYRGRGRGYRGRGGGRGGRGRGRFSGRGRTNREHDNTTSKPVASEA
jgi:protein LSM14